MTIMALSCVRNKYEEYDYLFNNSSIFNETIENFIENQLSDGSFGNVYTTALITQVSYEKFEFFITYLCNQSCCVYISKTAIRKLVFYKILYCFIKDT